MEADFIMDRFFHDAKEDFDSKAHSLSPEMSSDSPVHVTDGGSRHVKLKKVTDYKRKKIVCPKRKGHSKKMGSSVKPPTFAKKSSLKVKVKSPKAREKICDISTDHIQEQAYDSKALNNNSELLKSSPKDNKLSKKIKIKYHLDSNEDTDKVILDMTNRHLLADLENLINNNQTGELKTKMSSTKPPSENLPSTSRRKEFVSHTRPREWTKKQEMDQKSGLEALSTWEEDASYFPEMSREIILGVTMSCGELHFIVDWDGCRYMVKAEEAYRRIPMTCLKYYESLLVWNTNANMQINPNEVDVLSVNGAQQIGVRLKSEKEKYHKFVDELKTWFSKKGCQELHGYEKDSLCVWKSPTSWYRSIILSKKDHLTVRIRLVDAAKVRDVPKTSLFVLPLQFLSHRAFSFYIHLAQIPETIDIPVDSIWKYLKKHRHSLTLVCRGDPVVKFGLQSLPGEICWLETEGAEDPFAPSAEKHVTLSQCLFKDGLVKINEDYEEDSINNNSTDREIRDIESLDESHDQDPNDELGDTNVNTVQADYSSEQKICSDPPSFRWKDPILPGGREFWARGTHVDGAGQIYMHLYEERHKFTELRRTLNSHYQFSQPDCDIGSFAPGQEVVARWQESLDFPEEWYRARFLCYTPGKHHTVCWVYFVDWGNTSEMKTCNLRKELIATTIPIFAFKTILYDVLSFDHKDWTNDSLSFVHEKINFENKNVQGGRNIIRVRTMSKTGKLPLLVDIQLSTPYEEDVGQKKNVFISVSELLLERGDAVKASITEVNSKEQRKLRKKHDFGVRYDKKASQENKHSNQANAKKTLDSQIPSDVFEKIKPSVLLDAGTRIVGCQVQAFLAWNQLSVHLLSKNDTKTSYEELRRNLTGEVRESSAILLPRKGMTLAMLQEDLGWVRAEILDCDQETEDIYVRLVDFGTEEWVRLRPDNILFRYLPLHLKQVPCQAVTLQLPLVSDLDDDTLLSLMAENVLSATDTNPRLRIRVRHISNQTVLGHIIDDNNKVIYSSLEKENVIKIT